MARKTKRMSKKELRKPDEVEVVLQRTWERVMKHRGALVAGVVGFIALGVAFSAWGWYSARASQDRAEALRHALAPLVAPIGEAPEGEVATASKTPEDERFVDRKAAYSAAAERLEAFLAEYGSTDAAGPARIAQAGAMTVKGDAAGAVGVLESWLADNPESPLVPAALNQLALAQQASGDRAKAAETYRKVAAATTGAAKALALVSLGDLYHPLVVGGGDAAAAREAYESAREALGPRAELDPNDPFAARSETYLYADIDNKLAAL